MAMWSARVRRSRLC
ncbi:hypothetical protein F383_21534 [Gossypium arboreum]|uniref:Uncharacterized protein n=1 Tax=Gossypium arboreum TaxID=29729 RepID=A0A0B0P0T0_GOSAR|nr:hypothetical protein F383_21534 [Gossypium arboreum]